MAPLFDQKHLQMDYEPDLPSAEHVGMASVSFPLEDATQFHDLVDHVMSTLNLPAVPVEETLHPVFDIIWATLRSRLSLRILDGLLQPVKFMWTMPASCQPTSKKADKLYQIPLRGFPTFTPTLSLSHF